MSTTDGWLKLNFATCVILQIRSLGALVLCSVCKMVFVNYIYDMVVDTQFHKFHVRPLSYLILVFDSIFEIGTDFIVALQCINPFMPCLVMHRAVGISTWSYTTIRGNVGCVR